MYEIDFEINNQSINANFEMVQNSATAELILNVTPDRTSMLINDSGFINKDVNNLRHYMLSADITNELNRKVDKVIGKGLSTNDFTNDLKYKLQGIQAGAQVNTVYSVNGKTGVVVIDTSWGNITGSLTNQTDLKNALAAKQNKLTATYGLTITGDVISGKEITDVVDGISAVIPSAATEQNQLADKTWVGNQGYITEITSTDVINALGFTPYNSTNPNGFITQAVDDTSTTSTTLGWSASKLNGIIGDIETLLAAI